MSSRTAADEEFIYTDAFVADNSWNGRERNRLLLNRGPRRSQVRFAEAAAPVGLDSLLDPRGLAASDFDGDGDVDFVINNYRAQATYFENRAADGRAWLAVRLEGTRSNRDGIGATVTVRDGERTQARVVGAGHGYAGQYSLEQVFGLGDAPRADEVLVRWPDGRVERFGPFVARQRVRLVEGQGERAAPAPGPATAAAPAPAARFPAWLLGLALASLAVIAPALLAARPR